MLSCLRSTEVAAFEGIPMNTTRPAWLVLTLSTSIVAGCGGNTSSSASDKSTVAAIEASVRQAAAVVTQVPPSLVERPRASAANSQLAESDAPAIVAVRAGAVRRLKDDTVDCSYAIQVRNGGVAVRSLAIDLLASGTSSGIVSGRVTLGALAPGQTGASDESITLRDREACSIDLSKARWRVDAIPSSAERGMLLAGAPGSSAVAAVIQLIDNEPRARGADAGILQLTAVIDDSATVGQVNDALRVAGVRIVQMTQGTRSLQLEAQQASNARASAQEINARLAASQALESINGVSLRPQRTADVPSPPPVEDHQQPPPPQ